jgi:putative hydroxymethylpyrimidine transport system substrate-binding protein
MAAGGLGFLVHSYSNEVAPSHSTNSTTDYVLQLNGPITPSSAGALIAISDDLFGREGLSIQLRPGTSDADAASAVAADPGVIGLISAQGFLKARADGLPVVAFAGSYAISSVEFYALSDTKLLGPRDLEGKRIGFRSGSEASTIFRAFIGKNYISQSGLKIVESDRAVTDLVRGNIDVLVGHRDVEGQELDSFNVSYRSLSPDSFGVHAMGTVYFANERAFLSPGVLEKFLAGIIAGWNSVYSDESRTFPTIAAAVVDKSTLLQMSRFMARQRLWLRPSGTRFGELDLRRLKDLQDLLVQQRIILGSLDLNSAVNFSILEEVYRARSEVLFTPGP